MHFSPRKAIPALLLLTPLLFTACGGGSSGGEGGNTSKGGSATPAGTPSASTAGTPSASTARTPSASTSVATRAYAYVADDFASTVSGYSIDSTTGELTSLGTVETRGLPEAVKIHPSGQFAYVTNTFDPGFSAYRIDSSNGALILVGVTAPEGAWPARVAVDPSGSFLYLTKNYATDANPFPPPQVPQEISTYRIDPDTGEATLASTRVIGKQVNAIVVPPQGNVAYVLTLANSSSAALLSAYAIDPASGSLTPVAAVTATGRLAVHPVGRYAFVANSNVTVYRLDSSAGTLTQVAIVVPAATQPLHIAVHPSGNFVYVADNQSVGTYRFDANTGALISSAAPEMRDGGSGGSFGQMGNPVAFDPSGKFAYVSGASGIIVYSINPVTGALTPVGTPVARSRYALSIATVGVN